MLRSIGLVVMAFMVVGTLLAQDAAPVNDHLSVKNKKIGRLRIIRLSDRIETQRLRIAQGLAAKTISSSQAETCRTLLDSVEKQIAAEHKANGPKRIMRREQYDAYNKLLDANSALLNEQKEYFYYYGPYTESGASFDLYYDTYAANPTPTSMMITMKPFHPIFQLSERIKKQRAQIDQMLGAMTITQDQAQTGRAILDSVEKSIKEAREQSSNHQLNVEQYEAFNRSLDTNSTLIHENRKSFYYYKDADQEMPY